MPVWGIIQVFLIPILLIAALGGGLAVGYVILGKKELADVFEWSTWKHVYDLVFAP
nr:DNA-directed RNA polymerase subunit beta [Paenibacillus wynnii]